MKSTIASSCWSTNFCTLSIFFIAVGVLSFMLSIFASSFSSSPSIDFTSGITRFL